MDMGFVYITIKSDERYHLENHWSVCILALPNKPKMVTFKALNMLRMWNILRLRKVLIFESIFTAVELSPIKLRQSQLYSWVE